MAAKKRVEVDDDDVEREIAMISPCAGDIRAVVSVNGHALFVRVAVWAHVTQTLRRRSEQIVVGMIAPVKLFEEGDGALVFADYEPGFVGYANPGDDEGHWQKICRDRPSDEEDDLEDDE